MKRIKQIQLPHSKNSPNAPTLLDVAGGPLVITGANGSGKTRLGTWLEMESPFSEKVHRIAAQKSLAMPSSASTGSIEDAVDALMYGIPLDQVSKLKEGNQYSKSDLLAGKRVRRWNSAPIVSMLNDFQQLMDALHSDAYEISTRYLSSSTGSTGKIPTPETQLARVKRLWESVLPHRTLDVNSINIKAVVPESDNSYSGGAMSDGERAIFYLIGQCVIARKGSIIVIDEPELHIHRAIQGPLFDSVESERPDCLIVYITHDLDFAASRVGAKMMWLKEYDGTSWDWELVPEQEGVPEQMLLSILGSPKKVLLTEGDRSSLDYVLYSRAYPDRTVIPMGGCSEVLAATKTLRAMPSIYHLEPMGLIDRDYRNDEVVNGLQAKGVKVLEVHEVEQLLLTEPVITAVADSLARKDAASIVEAVKSLVFNRTGADFDIAVARLAANRIQLILLNLDTGVRSEVALKEEFDNLASKADPAKIFSLASKDLREALDQKNYKAVLRLYSNKGLVKEVADQFGFTSNNYVEHVKRLVASKNDHGLVAAIRGELPALV